MKKLNRHIILLLCLFLPVVAVAQADTTEIRRLEKDMYRFFGTEEADSFNRVIDQLKALTQKAGDEKLYYKAWCNQAINTFSHVSRERGLEIGREVREYAKEHDSKFGLYTSTYALASMLSTSKMLDLAERTYLEALDYKRRFFPEENAAAVYLGLAKVYVNKHDRQRVRECAEHALAEENTIPLHQLSAWSYMCFSVADDDMFEGGGQKQRDSVRDEFNRVYAEREKAKELLGHDDSFGGVVDFYHAVLNGHTHELVSVAQGMKSGLDQAHYLAIAYSLLGDYHKAYQEMVRFKKLSEQKNSQEVQTQSAQSAMQLNVARAENEAKDLRIANQQTIMKMSALVAAVVLVFLTFYLFHRRRQVRQLREAYDRLEATTSQKERIDSELRIAHDIQMGMVPTTFPERDDLDMYALMIPAKEVGGDLYDFYLQNDKLYFCVGDVSGKGVPASMTMMVVVNLFRTFVKDGYPPSYIVTRLNETLTSDNDDNGAFVTLFVGEIDLVSGSMDFCNAGHNPPVVIDVQHPRFLEMESNAPVGLWPHIEYVQEHIGNIKGKPLLIYTDGLTEAENGWQEQFGESLLLEALKFNRFESSRQTVELLQREVKRHVGEAEASDDLAMLCIYVKPRYAVMRKQLVLKNEVEELRRLAVFVEEIGTELQLDGMMLNNLQLVLEEAVSNVIFYAYPEGTQAHITLVAESDGHELTFTLSDQGQEFDPTLKPDADVDVHPAEREIGGLGIFIVKNIMNHVTYQRLEGRNLLTMKKSLKNNDDKKQ